MEDTDSVRLSRKMLIGLGLIASLFTTLAIFPPKRSNGKLNLEGFTDWEIKTIYAKPQQEIFLGRSDGSKVIIRDYNRNFRIDDEDEIIEDGRPISEYSPLNLDKVLDRVNRERYCFPVFIYRMF